MSKLAHPRKHCRLRMQKSYPKNVSKRIPNKQLSYPKLVDVSKNSIQKPCVSKNRIQTCADVSKKNTYPKFWLLIDEFVTFLILSSPKLTIVSQNAPRIQKSYPKRVSKSKNQQTAAEGRMVAYPKFHVILDMRIQIYIAKRCRGMINNFGYAF